MIDGAKILQKIEQLTEELWVDLDDPKPLTLGDLIFQLEKCIEKTGEKNFISFDFGSANPTSFGSYRSNTRHLCLQFSGSHSSEIYAETFLEICKKAVGAEFYCWKGGTTIGSLNSEVYVACEGCGSNTRVIGVEKSFYGAGIEIVTARMEDD